MGADVVPAVSAADLYKSFGSTRALQGVSLHLMPGRILALLGENGSGKSTFAKIIAGAQVADRGLIRRAGRPVIITDPAASRALGIAIVFQELSLAPDLDISDNIFLGREHSLALPGLLDRKSEEKACRGILDQLGLTLDPRQKVRGLGIAQKQMVEIAKALSQQPAVLILDEPTASLTRREVRQLFTIITQLRDAGTAILYVTHHLREVLEIADQVSVMRDGIIVAEREVTSATTEEELIELLTGRAASPHATALASSTRTPLLEIQHMRTSNALDVSIRIHRGEIVGLYGVIGCGREEVGRALVGLRPIMDGDIMLAGAPYSARDPADALTQGVGFLSSDRKQEGILPNRPIRENLVLSNLRAITRAGFLRRKVERGAATAQLGALRIKYASAEQPITTLSGGNQQKVLFGRALAARPRLLVMEDPTAGIDIGAKQDLYITIRAHAAEGMSFLWMSSDLAETLTLCDRVYGMYGGRIVTELAAPSMAQEDHLLAAVLGRSGASQPA